MVGGTSGWWVAPVDGGWHQWLGGVISGWWMAPVDDGWHQLMVGGTSGWWHQSKLASVVGDIIGGCH